MAQVPKLIYFVLVLVVVLPLPLSARTFQATDRARIASLAKRRRYAHGEWIPLFANKIFGAHERCDAYPYSSLPLCPPGEPIRKRKRSLNEILAGDCLTNTQYELKFGVSDLNGFLCEKHMTEEDLAKFKFAIANKFEYQMYFDNIWFRSKVGEDVKETGFEHKFYLFNHVEFNVDFMENQVIGINIVNSLDFSVDITNLTEIQVEFSYSVSWNDIKLTNNSNYYISGNETAAENTLWLREEDIRLVFSSFLFRTAITLCWMALLLAVSLPYLLLYLPKNRHPHGGIRRINDKACHCPQFTSLLGATLGVGTQHLIIIALLFVSAYEDIYPCNHDTISVDLIMIYSLMSVTSALIAISFHQKFSPIGWKECIFQAGTLYFFPVFLAVLLVNIFATKTLLVDRALFSIMIAGLGSAVLMSLLTAIRHFHRPEYDAATCVTKRLVQFTTPSTSWYMKTPGQIILGGLVPVLPIFLKMDDIYASLWGMKVCGSLVTLFVAFSIVIVATGITGIVYTSIQLLNNDYHWWWRSVLRGGSPAVYMFVYGIYFLAKLKTESYLELLPLLVYNGCICYSFFLVLGTIGFRASQYAFKSYLVEFRKKRS